VPVDVLDDDDGIVDENAHGERQRKHGEVVESEVEGPDQGEGGDDGHGQGHRADERGPDVPEEDEDGHHGQDGADDEVCRTWSMDSWMKMDWSKAMVDFMPGGRVL
jgi:hypothetical protein